MNENGLPNGSALRRAVRWLSERRSQSPGASMAALIEEASMRFDLSPLEANFLFDQLGRSEVPGGR